VKRLATGPVVRCAAALLLIAFACPALAQRTGSQPWQYPDRDSLEAAQRRHAGYWYENYEAATDLAASTRPRDLEEAIDKLRLSIAERPTSSLREMHPRNRYSFEYLPYYYLALAFSKLQRSDDALACLQREERFGLAARSGVAQEFSALQARLESIAAQRERRGTYGDLLDQATAVRGWLGGEGGVSLTPDGRQRVEQVGAAAEPPFRGRNHAGVHVDGGDVGVPGVGDQRDAGGPEARVFLGALDTGLERLGELAEHGGGVDADLFENAASHHAHDAAAAGFAGRIGALPGRAGESSGRAERELHSRRQVVLDFFKCRADVVAEGFKPGAGTFLHLFELGFGRQLH